MTKKKHSGIAVLEARWEQNSNISLRNQFDLISEINFGNHNNYHYEMINSEPAAKEAIRRIGEMRHCKILSINAHGSIDHLDFVSGQSISRTELRNVLLAIRGSQFSGLHLGSCSVGSSEFAEFMLSSKRVKLKWIAGYSEMIDWIDSTALDLLFFNEILRVYPGPALKPRAYLERVANCIRDKAEGLVQRLGFGLYVRRLGPNGGVDNLLSTV